MEPREAPVRTGGWMLWSLVSGSISSGLVPAEWRPVGGPWVACWGSSDKPGWAPSWGGPAPPRIACHAQGLCPDSQRDCQGGPVQILPTISTHSWGRFPGDPPAWGMSACPLLLSLDPTWAGRALVSPKWGHPQHSGPGVSWVTPTPQQSTRPAQASPVILPPPPPHFRGMWKAPAPDSPACPPLSWGLWHS